MRPTLKEFKKKALANPEVEKEYMELSPAYALRKQLIKIRKDAGLTQEELAEILHTK
ncbi:MAG: transcriptional regulator, partial [Deltaproteobacteria bacterium]|nr:transcriptional regulator [Deltaproteobacteria bacterium]